MAPRTHPVRIPDRPRRRPTLRPVTGPGWTLPPETASVVAARRHVQRLLDSWGEDAAAWTCMQLISELATNAVIHARTEFTVELSRHGDVIRACVRDSSPAAPGVRRYSEDSTTGRGLRLVESMANRWGIDKTRGGKVIWFEIDLDRQNTAASWDDGADIDLDAMLAELGGDETDVAGDQTASARARHLPRSRAALLAA